MTLNNLAGGVAGGLSGSGPLAMGFGALVASFVLMACGHWLGGWATAGGKKSALAGAEPECAPQPSFSVSLLLSSSDYPRSN